MTPIVDKELLKPVFGSIQSTTLSELGSSGLFPLTIYVKMATRVAKYNRFDHTDPRWTTDRRHYLPEDGRDSTIIVFAN